MYMLPIMMVTSHIYESYKNVLCECAVFVINRIQITMYLYTSIHTSIMQTYSYLYMYIASRCWFKFTLYKYTLANRYMHFYHSKTVWHSIYC